MSTRIALLLFAVLVLAACSHEGSQETTTPEARSSSEPATTPPAASQGAQPRPRVGFGPHRAAGTIGIPECDEFLRKYEACIAKAPEEARSGMQTTLTTWRSSWRALAASPITRETTAQNCRAAADSVRNQLESYDCEL